jgi:hypothetical protein
MIGRSRLPTRLTLTAAALAAVLALQAAPGLAPPAAAFCGFYVAKADARLFNRASQVVMVRHEDKTVITMVNDFKGDPKEFALVVPVPTVLQRGQIHVRDRALVEHLDAYSAPRLVEYFDPDPCAPQPVAKSALPASAARQDMAREELRARGLGVTIEARYTVGEYDILILSAQESAGLETWLRDSGYRLPPGASPVLQSYLRQGLKFFVARVNLTEQSRLGYSYLRPLQVAFESPRFMLPIRLGTVNAEGPQEMFVYALTRKGRVETSNYRTVRLPSGMDLPVHVKQDFPDFYKALFSEQVRREDRAVFLEYAWDMSWCDPCAADPLSVEELRLLGVFWLPEPPAGSGPGAVPRLRPPAGGPVDVFVTRLHVRYDGQRFPDDLQFQETADRQSFQARYVLRHAFAGPATCEAATRYREEVARRQEREAQTLASLTGWKVEDIRQRLPPLAPIDDRPWWRRIPER